MYFHRVRTEKLTIGEGVEFIGSFAFWLESDGCGGTVSGAQKSVSLPSSLKGIGNQAVVNLTIICQMSNISVIMPLRALAHEILRSAGTLSIWAIRYLKVIGKSVT